MNEILLICIFAFKRITVILYSRIFIYLFIDIKIIPEISVYSGWTKSQEKIVDLKIWHVNKYFLGIIEALIEVNMKITGFWNEMPWNLVNS